MKIPPELRAHVSARALGRCEYCLLHDDDSAYPHEVDHIISLKHGGETSAGNLAYACFACNRFKGTDLGSIGPRSLLVRFFNPRSQGWAEHLLINGTVLEPISNVGEVTARILRFNSAERVRERWGLQRLNRYPREFA